MKLSSAHRPVRQERSQRTLERLLDAAERLLEEKSFVELSLAELVREAGVTTGAFYSRFPAKDDLLPSLYARYLAWLRGVIDEELDPDNWKGRPLADRARRAADLLCRLFETRGGLLRAMVVFARLDPDATRVSWQGGDFASSPQFRMIQTLCDRLSEGSDPAERPERAELEFAIYGGITVARECILFPGLPMARGLGLDPTRLRAHLARLLEQAFATRGSRA